MLTNSGALTISSTASATSKGAAFATANLATVGFAGGIQQSAVATGAKGSAASAAVTNNAALNIAATAIANAGRNSANAHANLGAGISDSASGGDTVSASVTNNSTLNILSSASATAGTEASAAAHMGAGIFVTAKGDGATSGGATVGVSNTGALNIDATAFGGHHWQSKGKFHDATAHATISHGGSGAISESATGSFKSAVTLTNAGALNIMATATGNATGGGATAAGATARVEDGITQKATAAGALLSGATAANTLANPGNLTIAAVANAVAHGTNTVTGHPIGFAHATGDLVVGVAQIAAASTPLKGGAASATGNLTNNGSLNILGTANATGQTSDRARAEIGVGVIQGLP